MKQKIENSKILETAIELVANAHSTIQMTMNAKEEIENPLPDGYFQLLQTKMDAGVRVTRIGFGTSREFEPIRDRVMFENLNYSFIRTSLRDYRRILLIDGRKLLFVDTTNGKRQVFYSEEPSLISQFTTYLTAHTS